MILRDKPSSFVLAPLASFRGEGLGVRGFALRFDWIFELEFNAPPRFRNKNKSMNRRLASHYRVPLVASSVELLSSTACCILIASAFALNSARST